MNTAKRTCTALALALTVLPIIPAAAQSANDRTGVESMDARGTDTDDSMGWGWLGLLGLAGLAGLRRRDARVGEMRGHAATR